MTNTAMAATYL